MSYISVRDLGDGRTLIHTPYYQPFARKLGCKTPGAEWQDNGWLVPTEQMERIREVMLSMFGFNDEVPEGKTVAVKLTATERISSDCAEISVLGKTLLHNDRLGVEVEHISGSIYGNQLHQYISAGSEFLLRNVCESLYEAEKDKLPKGLVAAVVPEHELEHLKTDRRTTSSRRIWSPKQLKKEKKKESVLER